MHTTSSVDDEGKERLGAAPGGIVLNDFAPLSFAFLSLRLCPDPFSVTDDDDSADAGTVLAQYPALALLAAVRFAYPRTTTLQSLSLLARSPSRSSTFMISHWSRGTRGLFRNMGEGTPGS
jgi:hypothetical protein